MSLLTGHTSSLVKYFCTGAHFLSVQLYWHVVKSKITAVKKIYSSSLESDTFAALPLPCFPLTGKGKKWGKSFEIGQLVFLGHSQREPLTLYRWQIDERVKRRLIHWHFSHWPGQRMSVLLMRSSICHWYKVKGHHCWILLRNQTKLGLFLIKLFLHYFIHTFMSSRPLKYCN